MTLVVGLVSTTGARAQSEWRSYAGDLRNFRYSALDQINASNFRNLEIAWRFKTDSLGPRPEYKLEGTPLMVDGVVYATAGTRRSVIALDAATGELLWHGDLPYSGCATPATYVAGGRQYVVIATNNARNPKGSKGAAYVAYALP